jgi:hypothetical protein
MSSLQPLQAIASRRTAIAAEIDSIKADYETRTEALNAELKELEIAEKVLQRLDRFPVQRASTQNGHDSLESDNLTLREKLATVIREHLEVGLPGATGSEILAAMNSRWGEQNANSVRPTLWRMVQDKLIFRDGDLYVLEPKEAGQGGE